MAMSMEQIHRIKELQMQQKGPYQIAKETVLKEASNRRVGLKRALQLQAAAKDSIGVGEGLRAARLRFQQCLDEVGFWKAPLDETEAAMAEALRETGLAPYLLSVPGIGAVTAASTVSHKFLPNVQS